MSKKKNSWTKINFHKRIEKKLKRPPSNSDSTKNVLSDITIKECSSEEIEKKYNIKLEMQHAILPATKIPNTDLIIEDVLILSSAFSECPCEISSITICAPANEIRQKEKAALKLLIEKSNKSVMCDEDGEGCEILEFFENVAVVPIWYKDFDAPKDGNTYFCAKSTNGYKFQDIEKDELSTLIKTNPEDVFIFRLVERNLLHQK